MKYFRSPELAFWTVAVLALAALTVFASLRGSEAAPGGPSTVPVAAPGPGASQARAQVDALAALMPSGIAAGTNAGGLRNFSLAITEQARQGVVLRKGEGARDRDPLLRGFQAVLSDSGRLAERSTDPVAATALRTQIGLDVDHLHRIVLGLPAPDLPDTGLDPFQATTVSPIKPGQPSAPTQPSLPDTAGRTSGTAPRSRTPALPQLNQPAQTSQPDQTTLGGQP